MAVSVGLELGGSFVRAVVLERNAQSLRLVASAELPSIGTDDDLIATLTRLRHTLAIRQPIVLGLPTSAAIITMVQPLAVNPKRSTPAIQFELQQQLPYDATQAEWDYQWVSRNGESSSHVAVVAAVKRDVLEGRLACARRAGLTINAVSLCALAAGNAWFRGWRLATSPLGILLRLEESSAEWILISATGFSVYPVLRSASPSELAASSETSRVEGWLPALLASWNSVQELLNTTSPEGHRGHRVETPPPVWVCGGMEALLAVAQRLSRELRCPVEPLELSRLVRRQAVSSQPTERFAVACGLALQGLREATLSVNLLSQQQRLRQARMISRAARLITALSACLAIAVSARGMLTMLAHRTQTLADLERQERAYHATRPEIRALLKRQAHIQKRLEHLEALMRARSLLMHTLQQVIAALPDDLWLTKLESAKDQTCTVTLDGFARSFQSVTRLMEQITALIPTATVRPLATTVTTEAATGKELIAFSVQVQQPVQTAAHRQDEEDEPSASSPPAKPAKPRPAGSSSRTTRSTPTTPPSRGAPRRNNQ